MRRPEWINIRSRSSSSRRRKEGISPLAVNHTYYFGSKNGKESTLNKQRSIQTIRKFADEMGKALLLCGTVMVFYAGIIVHQAPSKQEKPLRSKLTCECGEPGVPSAPKEKESSIRSTIPEWQMSEVDKILYKGRRVGRSDFGFISRCCV